MPQLDPAPWFTTLTMTWLVFLTVIPSKVLTFIFTYMPLTAIFRNLKHNNWNWSWS